VSTLGLIIAFCLLGGVLSVSCAGAFLLAPQPWRNRILPHLLSFAVGAMLGAAFLALLPHAIADGHVDDLHDLGYSVLGGLLFFFLLEKLILWRHHHAYDGHDHEHGCAEGPAGYLILIGDGLHNFIDGIVIAAAFLTDAHLGIVTALAVAAHEIPQEVGDFAVLLASGFSRARALAFNLLTSVATVVGGVAAYFALSSLLAWVPYVLAVAAAGFIYVAVADLIPGLHKRARPAEALQQLILIVAGAALIHFMHAVAH
jgi:zinc and cadmium transporter